jgi:predicted Zn-dependent protease
VTDSNLKSESSGLVIIISILVCIACGVLYWLCATPSFFGWDQSESVSIDTKVYDDIDAMEPSVLFYKGNKDQATAAARALLKADKYNVSNLLCAGDLFCQIPELTDEGFEYLRRAVQLAPRSRWVRLNYARKLAQQKRYEEAIKQYQELSKLFSNGWSMPQVELAQLEMTMKDYEHAHDTLKHVTENEVENTIARKAYGVALSADNMEDDGFHEFTRAVNKDKERGYPNEVSDLVAKNANSFEKALVAVRKQAAEKPDKIDLSINEARLLIASKKMDEAKDVLSKVIAAHKDNADAHFVMAEYYLWNKTQQQAQPSESDNPKDNDKQEDPAEKEFKEGVKLTTETNE